MINWILNSLPWWAWLFIAAVPVAIFWPIVWPVFMSLPKPVKAAVAGLAAVILAYLAGRNKGAKDVKAEQEKAAREAIDRRLKSDATVDAMSDDELKRAHDKWLRE